MTEDRWRLTENLFHQAAELAPAQREDFLRQACGDDAELRADVESLIEADQVEDRPIIRAVKEGAADLAESSALIGVRLGGYRVVREIGRGGMGTVYLAERDDEQFTRQVAIKVVKRGMDTVDVLDRFRRERQILANLDHPYIGRIVDGGSTKDGRPYFTMDYVEGMALDQYLAERQPGVHERCQIFLRICEAVQYAHSKMTLHLDLKPANIFVTVDGSPKLLDFGVSKLLRPDVDNTATTHLRAFTPDYAAPEQLVSDTVSTMTDVYALGLILYEMLSGVRAHQFTDQSMREMERVVCEKDPKRLTEVAKDLPKAYAKDLEAITAKAMRKEPWLRYRSAEQFAEDLVRCWKGLPVLAREGNRAYLAKKFLSRNWQTIAAASLVALALITTTGLALVQARRASQQQQLAEQQRQRAEQQQQLAEQQKQMALDSQARETVSRKLAEMEAIQARRQQAIAERRFDVARELGSKLSLDMIETLRSLPGSMAARRTVLETGLRYFNELKKDAQDNPALMKEISRGYEFLGNVQGNPHYNNLGDAAGAMESYRKAFSIRERLPDKSQAFLAERIRMRVRIAQMQITGGQLKQAEATLREALALGKTKGLVNNSAVQYTLTDVYGTLGQLKMQTGDYAAAIGPNEQALALCNEIKNSNRSGGSDLCLSMTHARLAAAYLRLRREAEALKQVRASLAINQKLLDADPGNAIQIDRVLGNFNSLSNIYSVNPNLGTEEEIKKNVDAMVDLTNRALAAEPQNSRALYQAMLAQNALGDWLRHHKDISGSLPPYRRALELMQKYEATKAPALFAYEGLVVAHLRVAMALSLAGQLAEPLEHIRLAEEFIEKAERLAPGSLTLASHRASSAVNRGNAYVKQKMWKEAASEYERSIGIFDKLRIRDPKNLSHVYQIATTLPDLADCYEALGRRSEALAATEQSQRLLGELSAQRELSKEELEYRAGNLRKLAEWGKR